MKKKCALLALILFATPSFLLAKTNTTKMPKNFVEIREVIPNVVMDIRYFGPHNFIGEKIDGYEAPKCFLTKKAAEALANVQKELEAFSMSLKIYDCYRPQRAVNQFIKWAEDTSDTRMRKEFYPEIDKKNLFRDKYIAAKSGHSRGSTVDLTIVPIPTPKQENYVKGQALRDCRLPASKRFKDNSIDMGTGYDCLDALSNPENPKINNEQKRNRLLLKTLMDKYGFRISQKEWWHYSLRDEPYPNTYFDFEVK